MPLEIFNTSPGKLRQKKQSSVLKRKFFLFVSVGLVCSILPINTSAAAVDTPQNDGAANKCAGNVCAVERSETAARIIRYRDDTINPCDNFYRFACGNYKKTDKSNNYDHLISQKDESLEKLIQKGISSDFKPYKLIDDIYKTCMNKDTVGRQGLDLMKSIIKNLGNWPILEGSQWKEADFNWIDFTSNAKKAGYNLNYFLDWKPQFLNRIKEVKLKYWIKMTNNLFDPSMPERTASQKQFYSDYMVKVAGLVGAKDNDVAKEMKDVYDFEEKLSKISVNEDPNYTNQLDIEQLQKKWANIRWKKFVDRTLVPFVDSNEKPILLVWNSTALTEFVKLMDKTPKRVQANYAIWKIVQYSVPYLTEEFKEARKTFQKQVGYVGVPANDDCLGIVKTHTKYALLNLYLDQYKSSQESIKQMIKAFKDQMVKMMKESKTLSDEAKNKGIKIINEMPFTIGPSNKLSDPAELEKFYADVTVDKNNFLQTLLNLNLFKIKNEFSAKVLFEINPYHTNKLSKIGLPENVNGHLHIPMSMIPSPLFNNDRPMYMNFGSSGSYIAFSMASAVSYVGRNQTVGKELVDKQLDCFRHQYDDLTDESKKKNMLLNRPEESFIVQYIGFRTSWAAYQDYVAKLGTEPTLEGLPYTQGQLFWISFAQSFCSDYLNVNEPRNIYNDQLNILEYKMMKTLSNIPEISADFKCPVGSNMNQKQKCTWW